MARGDKPYLRKSTDRKAQISPLSWTNAFPICAAVICRFSQVRFITPSHLSHAQSLFLLPKEHQFFLFDCLLLFCILRATECYVSTCTSRIFSQICTCYQCDPVIVNWYEDDFRRQSSVAHSLAAFPTSQLCFRLVLSKHSSQNFVPPNMTQRNGLPFLNTGSDRALLGTMSRSLETHRKWWTTKFSLESVLSTRLNNLPIPCILSKPGPVISSTVTFSSFTASLKNCPNFVVARQNICRKDSSPCLIVVSCFYNCSAVRPCAKSTSFFLSSKDSPSDAIVSNFVPATAALNR